MTASDDVDNILLTLETELEQISADCGSAPTARQEKIKPMIVKLKEKSETHRAMLQREMSEENIWFHDALHLHHGRERCPGTHISLFKLLHKITEQIKSHFTLLGGKNRSKSLTNKKNINKISKKTNVKRLSFYNKNIYKSKNNNIKKNKISKRK